jgi:hypothetical protein
MADLSLIKKFITIYNSTQTAIDSNDKSGATEKYKELLEAYNKIKDSDLEHSHKKIAFAQIQKAYKDIQGIDARTSFSRYAILAAVFVILISFAVVIKPSMFGLMVLEKGLYGNEAPQYTGQKAFDLPSSGTLEINLNDQFKDPDGDTLTFLTKHQKGLKIALANEKLTLSNDGATGEVPVELIASDGRIIVRETVTVKIV